MHKGLFVFGLVLLCLGLLPFMGLPLSLFPGRGVGVQVGDWWKYDNIGNTVIPYHKVEVQSISGSIVTLNVSRYITLIGVPPYWDDGSLSTIDVTEPLKTSTPEQEWYVVATNLQIGDQVIIDDIGGGITEGDWGVVEETVLNNYWGELREINIARLESQLLPETDRHLVELYYDKETGVLCELKYGVLPSVPTTKRLLIEADIFEEPPPPPETGTLTVRCYVDNQPHTPDNNRIYVNNEPYVTSVTGYWSEEVETGSYSVRATYDGVLDLDTKTVYKDQETLVELRWETQVETYALIVNIGVGGTTSPPLGTYQYEAGSQVSVTAIPSNGYVFDYWTLDGVPFYSTNPIIFNKASKTETLTANFKETEPSPDILTILFNLLKGYSFYLMGAGGLCVVVSLFLSGKPKYYEDY